MYDAGLFQLKTMEVAGPEFVTPFPSIPRPLNMRRLRRDYAIRTIVDQVLNLDTQYMECADPESFGHSVLDPYSTQYPSPYKILSNG